MNERYPLDQWLDGQVWELDTGVDFVEDVPTFRSGLRYWAKLLYGKRITSRIGKRANDPGVEPRWADVLRIQAHK